MEALSLPELAFFAAVIILSYAIRGSAGFDGVTLLLGLGVLRVSSYIVVGAYDRDALLACAAALPLMALGAVLGNRIRANLEQLKFRRLVAAILLASGIPLVLH